MANDFENEEIEKDRGKGGRGEIKGRDLRPESCSLRRPKFHLDSLSLSIPENDPSCTVCDAVKCPGYYLTVAWNPAARVRQDWNEETDEAAPSKSTFSPMKMFGHKTTIISLSPCESLTVDDFQLQAF